MQGNALAYLMLLAWPAVVAWLFARHEPKAAAIWAILGGYLLLPPAIWLPIPILPDLDKTTGPALATLVALGALGLRPLRLPAMPLIRGCLLLYLVMPIITAAGNTEPLIVGVSYRPAYDITTAVVTSLTLLLTVAPFLIARNVLNGPDDTARWQKSLLFAGLLYTIPMVIEVRLSPQINVWVYGYFAHEFLQMIRYGGFRPMVFLTHGLWVALFAFTVLGAAAVQARAQRYPRRMIAAVAWMVVVMVLCKSLSSLVYVVLGLPLLLLAPPRWQLRVAAVLAVAVLSYPLMRSFELVPVERLAEWIMEYDLERGGSLLFRLEHEAALLAYAMEKPLTGWGLWGRSLIVNPVSGELASVSDGHWVISLGVFGVPGFLAEFGLYALPVLAAWRTRAVQADPMLAGLVLVHALTLVDLFPNATTTPLTWIVAGLITGQVERLRAGARDAAPQVIPADTTATAAAPAPGRWRGAAAPARGATPVIRTIL